MDHDEEYSSVPKQRATREEVRRRNREVMEKANAELRESKTVPVAASKPIGKKDYSRIGLIQKHREGTQSFYCDYKFHNSTPRLPCDLLRREVKLDASKFVNFDPVSATQLFNECLRTTCLIDEASVTYLDLINPEETYSRSGTQTIDRADECLLTNEAAGASLTDLHEDSAVYTGHFLRKPQLMSNDLFTEGDRSGVGQGQKYTAGPVDDLDEIDDEFEQVALIDEKFKLGESVENKVTRTNQRIKRVLSILPDTELRLGEYAQFKFDEPFAKEAFESLMTNNFEVYDRNEDEDCYVKKQKFIQANKSSMSSKEEFYLLRIPTDSSLCFIKQLGSKILLKKDTRGIDSSTTIRLIRRE